MAVRSKRGQRFGVELFYGSVSFTDSDHAVRGTVLIGARSWI